MLPAPPALVPVMESSTAESRLRFAVITILICTLNPELPVKVKKICTITSSWSWLGVNDKTMVTITALTSAGAVDSFCVVDIDKVVKGATLVDATLVVVNNEELDVVATALVELELLLETVGGKVETVEVVDMVVDAADVPPVCVCVAAVVDAPMSTMCHDLSASYTTQTPSSYSRTPYVPVQTLLEYNNINK